MMKKRIMCGTNSGWNYSRSVNVILTSWKSLLGAATALHSSRYWAHVHSSVLLSPASPQIWTKHSVNSVFNVTVRARARAAWHRVRKGLGVVSCHYVYARGREEKQILHSRQARKWGGTIKKSGKRTNVKKKRGQPPLMCLLSALESSVFSSCKNKPQVRQHRKQQKDGRVSDSGLDISPTLTAHSWASGRPTVPSMSESSSEGLRYSFLFLFLMGFRWSGLREETLPPAGTFSTPPILLLGCRHSVNTSLDWSLSPYFLFACRLFVPHGQLGGSAAVYGEPYWSKRCLGLSQNSSSGSMCACCASSNTGICACSQLISGNGGGGKASNSEANCTQRQNILH